MATIKCANCQSEWNSSVSMDKCPFCGKNMSVENYSFADIDKLFGFIIGKYGVDIVRQRGKFYSMAIDYAPSLSKELKLVKVALDSGVYDDLINVREMDLSYYTIIYNKSVAKLENEYFVSRKWAETVLSWLMKGIGIKGIINEKNDTSQQEFQDEIRTKTTSEPIHKTLQQLIGEGNLPCRSVLIRAVEGNENKAQYELAEMYYYGTSGLTKDYNQAMFWYTEAAEQGYERAMLRIAKFYYFGDCGVSEDRTIAMKWFDKYAEHYTRKGDAESQFELAEMYNDGKSALFKDCTQALIWYTKAAEQGHKKSMRKIAEYYRYGKDEVPKDISKAIKWYIKCADNGDIDSLVILGDMYYQDKDGCQNQTEAVKWYTKAAEKGDAEAQYKLGVCYDFGDGVKRDEYTARKWYIQAAEKGNADAEAMLKIL